MNNDRSVFASQAEGASTTAAPSSQQQSNRTSPFPPSNMAAAAAAAAAAADRGPPVGMGFPPSTQSYRPGASFAPFPGALSGLSPFDRDTPNPIGTPFTNSPAQPITRALIRRLPVNTSEESLRLMVVWSTELIDVELLPVDQSASEDAGFRSALMRFRSLKGAQEVKQMLNGRSNISNDADMIVQILPVSPPSGRRHTEESTSTNASSAASSAASSVHGSRQPSRFNGGFPAVESLSPTSNPVFPVHDLPNPDASMHYQNLFSPHSPIGNHLSERPRVSGKTVINDNLGDDDETSDLLKDPVAYAENGPASHRRATAPQIPISRLANLSLNTSSSPPGPSSLPQYISSAGTPQGPISPINGAGPGGNYPTGPGQHYPRHNFPPVNPADQNPPCNTLYVGNLPIDTSEEELKAMFSKQRGYKRLCFRTKQNGPMCFVEFEDVSFATKALHDLYGHPLHNSVKGGIRLSFSKNPLGVRSGQGPGPSSSGSMSSMNAMMHGMMNGFTTAHGPPPGLSAPPGLGAGRTNYNHTTSNGNNSSYHSPSYSNGGSNSPWNNSRYNNGMSNGGSPALNGSSNFVPSRMLGK